MMIMYVPLIEWLCQTVTEYISTLEYLLPGERKCLWPRPVL
jgi:hypothetical protein